MSGEILVACETREKAPPYVEALKAAGAREESIRVLSPEEPDADAQRLAAGASGLVLCGGPDLEPRRYGEAPRPDARLDVVPLLDQLDWELLLGARAGRTPVWAICRGMQTVNVFQGGTLWQDIYAQVEGVIDHSIFEPHDAMAHAIRVVRRRESFGEILVRQEVQVNSRHHQAVKHLGRALVAVAESPDGLVEVLALESDEWWVKGVQWHPENLIHLTVQRRLWAEFIQAAAAKGR